MGIKKLDFQKTEEISLAYFAYVMRFKHGNPGVVVLMHRGKTFGIGFVETSDKDSCFGVRTQLLIAMSDYLHRFPVIRSGEKTYQCCLVEVGDQLYTMPLILPCGWEDYRFFFGDKAGCTIAR